MITRRSFTVGSTALAAITLARPAFAQAVPKTARLVVGFPPGGSSDIAARLPQARETTAANTATAAPRRELLHPGVRKYLGEIGLLR